MMMELNNDVDPLSNILNKTILCKRKSSEDVLVTDCNNAAKKIEPGYLVNLATQIEKANNIVFHSAHSKLKLIEEQMAVLKKQAFHILIDTKISSVLHSLPCNFPKKAGQIYSVYEKADNKYYFSLLSPEEWGDSCPHKFIGSFKLKDDMNWCAVDENSAAAAVSCWVQNNENLMIELLGSK